MKSSREIPRPDFYDHCPCGEVIYTTDPVTLIAERVYHPECVPRKSESPSADSNREAL